MRMLIRYQNGTKVEGLLLAASRDRMRVAVAGQGDTSDLNRQGDCWYAENDEFIEFEAMIPVEGTDCSTFCSDVYPKTMAAGRSFQI